MLLSSILAPRIVTYSNYIQKCQLDCLGLLKATYYPQCIQCALLMLEREVEAILVMAWIFQGLCKFW